MAFTPGKLYRLGRDPGHPHVRLHATLNSGDEQTNHVVYSGDVVFIVDVEACRAFSRISTLTVIDSTGFVGWIYANSEQWEEVECP